jgi:hypothetical protein
VARPSGVQRIPPGSIHPATRSGAAGGWQVEQMVTS